jgi:hypothetical protein
MALVVKDRVKETTTTTGTGTFTLAGAATGFQSFSVIGNGNTTYYAVTDGTNWEVGIGTYTSSGTTLSRDTILESSNSGSAVNFSAGSKDVFVTYPAERAVYTDAAGTAITPATSSRLGFTNLAQGSALSVLGVTGNATADVASIAAGTDHQVLRRSGTAVGFGAVNLAQAAAITGTLPVGNGGTGATTLTANNVILGNGGSAVQFVAPSTSGNVLTSNGSTWQSSAAAREIPSGSIMLFVQTAAPTGWTKDTTSHNNKALRVVTGTAASGGSVAFTTAFASQTPSGSVATTTTTANATATNQAATATNQAATATNQAATATNQAATQGGSVSTTLSGGSIGNYTLATADIPSHTHTYVRPQNFDDVVGGSGTSARIRLDSNTGATGGGGSHTHALTNPTASSTFTGSSHNHTQDSHNHTQNSHNHTQDSHNHTQNAHNHTATSSSTFTGSAINLAVQYVDVIIASKD